MAENKDHTDRELELSAEFDFPPELIWRAWSKPEHLSKWWGPEGFTNTFTKFEFRMGGAVLFTMHSPDGINYPNHFLYHEIKRPNKIVYSHGSGDINAPADFETTITLEDLGEERTLLIMTAKFPTKEIRDTAVNELNAVEGGEQALGRLDDYMDILAELDTL